MDLTFRSPKEAHRHFARQTNRQVWEWLERASRSPEEDELMIHAAHASCYHWLRAGTGVHHQRAEWLLARVYTVTGHPQAALRHARRCLALTDAHRDQLKDFDLAYAWEALARAQALNQDPDAARETLIRARRSGQSIANEEDRALFFQDLEGGDWYGLSG